MDEALTQFYEWKEWAIPFTPEGEKLYEAQKTGWLACWEFLTNKKEK